jgi:hypothetical protein
MRSFNYKVLDLIEIYNFVFDRFSIEGDLGNSKNINFKIINLKT